MHLTAFPLLFQWEKKLNPDPCHDGSEADVPESSVIDSALQLEAVSCC